MFSLPPGLRWLERTEDSVPRKRRVLRLGWPERLRPRGGVCKSPLEVELSQLLQL